MPCSPNQLPEQALERVVERAHLEQLHVDVARDPGERDREVLRVAGLDHEPIPDGVERHAADGLQADQGRRQSATVVGAHEDVARSIVHRVAKEVMGEMQSLAAALMTKFEAESGPLEDLAAQLNREQVEEYQRATVVMWVDFGVALLAVAGICVAVVRPAVRTSKEVVVAIDVPQH